MKHRCVIALLLILGLGGASAASPKPAWPQVNGPYGNFTPRQYGLSLVTHPSEARQLWVSDYHDLGYAKGSVSGYFSHLARWEGHPGSCSGPILAEGKLFVASFRPAGRFHAEKQPGLDKVQRFKKPLTPSEQARLQENLRILADDLLVAIDADTGRTVWEAAESLKGLNRYMGKRQGFNVSPVYHDGMVFSLGTMGRLYAYRASDGRKVWEQAVEPLYGKVHEHRLKCLDDQRLPGGMGWNTSLTVAGNVLVVPLFDANPDQGLRGLSVSTGETLWELPKVCSRHATPATWSYEGRSYILTATVSGELRMIRPEDGQVLWKVDGLGENHFSLTPSSQMVLVNGGSRKLRREGKTQTYGLLAGYRITPDQADRVWKHPEGSQLYFSTWMDSCARRFLAVDDGRIYFRTQGVAKTDGRFFILDESSGRVLAETPLVSPAPHFYPVEDRLLVIRDASHRMTRFGFFSKDPADFRQTADFWEPPHQNTTAYEVLMEHVYANGRFYLRTLNGRIACYDLTRK